MTIGDYIKQVQAVEPSELAALAIDTNGESITAHVTSKWDEGVNPDGDELSAAGWSGEEVSAEYRAKWHIRNRLYKYRKINISGDTRRGLKVSGGRIFSLSEYWAKILRRFSEAGFSPVSFRKVPAEEEPKKTTAAVFFRLLRGKIAKK